MLSQQINFFKKENIFLMVQLYLPFLEVHIALYYICFGSNEILNDVWPQDEI